MVDYTYFEESLSPNEYPDIDLAIAPDGQYSLDIGGYSPYEAAEGAQVSIIREKYSPSKVVVKTKHGDEITLEVEGRTTMARFTLRVKEDGQNERTIAYGLCDKGL